MKYLPEYHIIGNKFSVIICHCGSTSIKESIMVMKCESSQSDRMFFNCIWHECETSLFEGCLKKKQYGYCLVPCCGIADTLIRILLQAALAFRFGYCSI